MVESLDIVVFGASGFVGRLTAAYLAAQAPPHLRVGLAGRSTQRLADVRASLGETAVDWPLLEADAADPKSLQALAGATPVVVTTVGPYTRHGLPLVEACAAAGTDYADLAGEVVFVRRSIDTCHDVASATGARIVHACGFDSIPSDLGVLLLSERARDDGAGDLAETTLGVLSAKGGVSGGTIDSMRTQLDAVRSDPALRRLVADPYALSPDRGAEPPDPPRIRRAVRRDPQLGRWTAPFVMAPYNTRIVRRSNALTGHAYGRTLRYREVVAFGPGPLAPIKAAGATLALGALAGGMTLAPTRAALSRLLPSPGEGPSEATSNAGHFRMEIRAGTTGGAAYVATIAASGDPGYAATAVMLGESALCLAHDRSSTPQRAGVLTPATALGTHLAARLRTAGFEFTVSRRSAAGPDGDLSDHPHR